jgi:RNA polymerase sigma-70 factor (ECF subfamily)
VATRSPSLARQLLALVDGDTHEQLAQLPDLEALLASFLDSARSAWPTLDLPPDLFLRYLAARVPRDGSVERAFRNLCVEDLYLCCACAAGNQQAVALFHQHYLPLLQSTLRGLRIGETMTEEVQQHLLERLLAGSRSQPAMITTYGGYGRLARWLRVVAARIGRSLLAEEKKLVLVGDERIAAELADHASEPEIQSKQVYRELFKRAFKHALKTLEARELNLLRQRYVDNLNLAQIGAIYRVHHTTVHRWLEKAKAVLLERTRAHMREALEVSQGECESIIRLIQSDLDLTLQTFLSQTPVVKPR